MLNSTISRKVNAAFLLLESRRISVSGCAKKKHESHLMGARAGRFCERQFMHGQTTPSYAQSYPLLHFLSEILKICSPFLLKFLMLDMRAVIIHNHGQEDRNMFDSTISSKVNTVFPYSNLKASPSPAMPRKNVKVIRWKRGWAASVKGNS